MHGGDQLARGMHKAQFPPAGGAVNQEKWDAIFEGFDETAYRRDADKEQAGVSSTESSQDQSGLVRVGPAPASSN